MSSLVRKTALFFFSFFSFLCYGNCLVPFSGRQSSLLTTPVSEELFDPFKILEQIPFGVDKEALDLVSAARVDWKETSEGHV
ncbi:hypothetical protein AMTRI_Chr11g158810 [Amborella trichopoda]